MPAILEHALPLLTAAGGTKLQARLDSGCAMCEIVTQAVLTRRSRGGGDFVQLQCTTCFGAIGGALSRADHPCYESYPLFPEGKHDEYVRAGGEARKAAFEERRAALRSDYQRFLLGPEWKRFRHLVMNRASGFCEACLEAKAEHVHHLTYDLGWLPPAFYLRAVCERCHERLHPDQDNEPDEWAGG